MKRAHIDVTADVLFELAALLTDHGLEIIAPGTVRLIVQGDALPDECEGRCPLVYARLVTEQHGMRRINKVHSLIVMPEPERVHQGDNVARVG